MDEEQRAQWEARAMEAEPLELMQLYKMLQQDQGVEGEEMDPVQLEELRELCLQALGDIPDEEEREMWQARVMEAEARELLMLYQQFGGGEGSDEDGVGEEGVEQSPIKDVTEVEEQREEVLFDAATMIQASYRGGKVRAVDGGRKEQVAAAAEAAAAAADAQAQNEAQEQASQEEAAKVQKQIMAAALDGRKSPSDRQPFAIVMWGGIGAGKSTASTQVFETLGMADASQSMVDLNVDELVQSVPEFRASIGTEHEKEAYMTYRNAAKQIQKPLAQASLEQGLDVYVEWTNEGNMHALSKAESDVLQREALEAKGYTVVLCLVECRDVEGILVATKEREKVDGRHIPEAVIRTYNQDRAKHWLTALANWSPQGVDFRALVETRLEAGSAGEGLIEMSGGELPDVELVGSEDDAREVIDGVREAQSQAKSAAEGQAKEQAEKEVEEQAKKLAEAKAKQEANALALKEAEAKEKEKSSEKAKKDTVAKAKDAEAKAKKDAEAKAKDAEAKAKKDAEATAKKDAEATAKKDAAKAKQEAEAKAKTEAAAKAAKAKQEAEAKAKTEAAAKAAKAKQEAEAKAKTEAAAKAAKVKQEAEAKAKTEAAAKAAKAKQGAKEAEARALKNAEDKVLNRTAAAIISAVVDVAATRFPPPVAPFVSPTSSPPGEENSAAEMYILTNTADPAAVVVAPVPSPTPTKEELKLLRQQVQQLREQLAAAPVPLSAASAPSAPPPAPVPVASVPAPTTRPTQQRPHFDWVLGDTGSRTRCPVQNNFDRKRESQIWRCSWHRASSIVYVYLHGGASEPSVDVEQVTAALGEYSKRWEAVVTGMCSLRWLDCSNSTSPNTSTRSQPRLLVRVDQAYLSRVSQKASSQGSTLGWRSEAATSSSMDLTPFTFMHPDSNDRASEAASELAATLEEFLLGGEEVQ
jgi:hypothetical protein